MTTAKKTSPAKRPARRKIPDHILFNPIEGLPDWAHTLMGEDTAFIELPDTVYSCMVVQFTHDGEGAFEFQLLDERALKVVREVSGTGKLCERRSVNFVGERGFKYILASVTGSWIVHFQSLADMEILDTRPGSRIEGNGSDLLRFENRKPTRLDFSMPCTRSGVEIWSLNDRRERIINSFTPYSGTFIAPTGLLALEIITKDSWKHDVQWSLTVGRTTGAPDFAT